MREPITSPASKRFSPPLMKPTMLREERRSRGAIYALPYRPVSGSARLAGDNLHTQKEHGERAEHNQHFGVPCETTCSTKCAVSNDIHVEQDLSPHPVTDESCCNRTYCCSK